MRYNNKIYDNTIVDVLFHSMLWTIMLLPLYLSIINAIGFNKNPIEPEILPSITPIIEEIELTNIDTDGFIWEKEDSFDQAFRMARSLLGPDKVFSWNTKEYNTLYKEELDID